MKSYELLMDEHRLIDRMIALCAKALKQIETANAVDPFFVDTAFDFICMYADRTHHGKEEAIYFRALEDKDLSPEDRRIMNELVHEHVLARKSTSALIEANARYRSGDKTALNIIASSLRTLVTFYPKHIEKEDKVFFVAARAYFSDEEDNAMLEAFQEFDRQMIHEKYRLVVEHLENN